MANARNLANLANNVTTDGRLKEAGCSGIVGTALGGTASNITVTAGGVFYGTGSGVACTTNMGATSGQILLSNGAGAPYWGSLPAATTTQLASGSFMMGMSSVTISPLMLTTYKFVYIYISNLNCMMSYGLQVGSANISNQSNSFPSFGMVMIDLINNTASATMMRTSGSGVAYLSGTPNITTMSGSITMSVMATTFTSGSYILYGQP